MQLHSSRISFKHKISFLTSSQAVFAVTKKVLIVFGMSFVLQSQAAGFHEERNLSMEFANQLANETVKNCADAGYNVAVTVLDRGGNPKAVLRMDNAGAHTVEASKMKAFTALSAKTATQTVMENAQSNVSANNLVHIPGFLLLGGGLPVKSGEQVIGAIGVGGAPGGHLDHQCAEAALTKFVAELK